MHTARTTCSIVSASARACCLLLGGAASLAFVSAGRAFAEETPRPEIVAPVQLDAAPVS